MILIANQTCNEDCPHLESHPKDVALLVKEIGDKATLGHMDLRLKESYFCGKGRPLTLSRSELKAAVRYLKRIKLVDRMTHPFFFRTFLDYYYSNQSIQECFEKNCHGLEHENANRWRRTFAQMYGNLD